MFFFFLSKESRNVTNSDFAVGTRPCKPDANLYPFILCGVCLFPVGWIEQLQPAESISQTDQHGAHSDEGHARIHQKITILKG